MINQTKKKLIHHWGEEPHNLRWNPHLFHLCAPLKDPQRGFCSRTNQVGASTTLFLLPIIIKEASISHSTLSSPNINQAGLSCPLLFNCQIILARFSKEAPNSIIVLLYYSIKNFLPGSHRRLHLLHKSSNNNNEDCSRSSSSLSLSVLPRGEYDVVLWNHDSSSVSYVSKSCDIKYSDWLKNSIDHFHFRSWRMSTMQKLILF